MPDRFLPVRPDLDQLKHQAKDLLREIQRGEAEAVAALAKHHPERIAANDAKLADAQLALAHMHGAPSWPRMVLACRLIDAIWTDDIETVRDILSKNPVLLHESARIQPNDNWGPPMSYAANLGRDAIVQMLHDMGARDHGMAKGRALLQSKTGTARLLHRLMGSPKPPAAALGGSAYTLSVAGTALVFEFGGTVFGTDGKPNAPVDVVLETDSRNPSAKHAILEMYAQHGMPFPDTPVMALHRGRIDLLEAHLHADPGMLRRTFTHEEIYPPELGCHDEVNATQGTPLKGTTLLHLCADYDELEIAEWLISRGMDVNAKAAVDPDGFGGHTSLFGTVVSQPNFWMNHGARGPMVAPFTALLLSHGADVNVRVSLPKQLHPGYGDESLMEFRDVTALSWGRRFHRKEFVSEPAMQIIVEYGGHE